MGRFPRKKEGYECPDCGDFHEDFANAEDCCPREIDKVERWQCSVCDEIYEEREEAYSCCD